MDEKKVFEKEIAALGKVKHRSFLKVKGLMEFILTHSFSLKETQYVAILSTYASLMFHSRNCPSS